MRRTGNVNVSPKQQYNTARLNLLLMIAFTLLNIVMLFAEANYMLLFSATVPYYAVVMGVADGTGMLLVPGMALTNAMREIMAGDIMSGLSRMAEVILLASAIALGVIVGLWLGQLL